MNHAKLSRFLRLTPALTLIMLFPGMYFYQTLLGLGYISAFLGGYFGVISILLFPLVVAHVIMLYLSANIRLSVSDFLFFGLMAYAVLNALFHFFWLTTHAFSGELFAWSMAGILFNLHMFLMARTIDFSSRRWFPFFLIILLLMLFVAFFNVGEGGAFYLRKTADNADHVATYQAFARSIVVVGLFALALAKKDKYSFLVAIITFLALFVNGARSEFIGFIVAFVFMGLYSFDFRKIGCMLLFAVLSLYAFTDLSTIGQFSGNRIFELFDILDSSSAIARSELLRFSIFLISENPFFGNYGGYVSANGIGGYAHNIISAWVNLGFLGFLGFLVIFCWIGFRLVVLRACLFRIDYFGVAAVLFFVYCAFLMLTSKDYSYMIFGLMVGLFSRAEEICLHENGLAKEMLE